MRICFLPLLRSTTTFPRGLEQPRQQRKVLCFSTQLRFKPNSRATTPSPDRRARAIQSKAIGSHLLRLLLLPHHLPLPHHHHHLLLLRRQPRRLRKFPRRPRRFSSPFSRSGELAILIIAPRPPERTRKARRRKSISQTKPPFRYKKKKSVVVVVVVVSSVFCMFLFRCMYVNHSFRSHLLSYAVV